MAGPSALGESDGPTARSRAIQGSSTRVTSSLPQAPGAIGEVALDRVGQSVVDRAAAEVGELIGGWMGVGRERGLRHSWEPCPDWEKPFGRGWPGQVTKRSEPKVAANQACAHGGEQHQTRLGGRLGDWQRVCTPQDRRRAFGCVSLKIVT